MGENTKAVQFTVHHFKEGGKKHVYYAHTYKLGFNSSDDYHNYAILWNKNSISWFVDGKQVCIENRILLEEAMHIRLNHWAADTFNNNLILNWMGLIDTSKLPSRVYFDYVKYVPLK